MSLRSIGGNRRMANAFIPEDRRRALAAKRSLPARAYGAALFADISGFTQLTEGLARQLGPRLGAEILTRQLNLVYSALISAVEAWHGSVIGFSGDAITCWFDEDETEAAIDGTHSSRASLAAVNAAFAMQDAMLKFARLVLPGAVEASLALRTTVITSAASRLQVGEPSIQLIDVLAGRALDALADADHAAHQGDVVVDSATLVALHGRSHVQEWRTSPGGKHVAVLAQIDLPPPPEPADGMGQPLLDDSVSRQWVLGPVYERLRSEGGRFLAELRPATALFLQFRGLDFDDDAHAGTALDGFVRWVQGVVHEHEGALIQLTTGDKGSYLYAAFGAPITHDDDAQRAVAAALSLRSPPPEFGAIRDIRIGISQGMMRVGTYGSDSRLTYGVLGDATNLAARLMVQAEPQQICISANVAAEVAARFEIVSLGMRRFKGKAEAQQVFAVLRARTQTADYAAAAAAPLVGRSAELSQLQSLLKAAAGRTGAVVRLVGEAGAGKSHFTSHVANQAAERGMQVVFAACQSTAQNSAYFAAQQFVRSLLSLPPVLESEGGLDKHAQVRRLESALEALGIRWMLRLPLLGDLLSLPIPDNPTTAAFDARMRQEALAALVIDIVRGAAQERPLLLVIEDAHWLDEASRALVQSLAHVAATSSTLLLLVHRPFGPEQEKLAAEWDEIAGQQTIQLSELDAAGTAQLVRQRLAGDVEPLGLAFIHSLAQGNPFFTEELVDALREGSLLQQEGRRWQLSRPLLDALRRANCLERIGSSWQLVPNAPLTAIDIGVPSSINGLVLSRLDRLPEDNKLTLKVASVIGRVFELDLLAAAHPSQPDLEMLEPQFRLLQQRDFARVETQKPRPVYVFKHNITQEVVYQTLLESQRQVLHVAVAEAIEARSPDDVERLAHHYGQGDTSADSVRTKAIHYIEAAGWRARKEHANETALTYFDRALQFELRWSWLKGRVEVLHILGRRMHEEATLLALEELGSEDPQEQMEVAMLWAKLYTATGDYRPAAESLSRALALALERGSRYYEARCYAEQANINWRQGDYAAAQNGYLAALRLAGPGGTQLEIESEAHYGLGIVYRQQSRYDEARKQFEQALMAAERLGDLQYEARALNALGSVAGLERDYLGAAELFAHALEIRETIGDRAGIGASLMSLAQSYGSMGDYSRVEALLRQALEIQQAMRNRWEEMLIHNELGILYTTVGQDQKAFVHLEQAIELAGLIESEIGAAYILCNLGQAERDAGRTQEALATLQRGLLLAQAQGDMHLEAIYLNDWALTNLRIGAYQEAVAQAQRSRQLFLELDQPLALTAVYACLSAAYSGAGDQAAAEAAALSALSLLDGCGGEGPDFPQRDYWICARTLAALGRHETARRAAEQAHLLLRQRADRISDETMRGAYLTQVAVHAEIIASESA